MEGGGDSIRAWPQIAGRREDVGKVRNVYLLPSDSEPF